jgi:hypothetical protein
MSITIETKNVKGILKRVNQWAKDVDGKDLKPIVALITEDYKKQIRAGNDGSGKRMPLIKISTLKMPVRFGDLNSPIREDVNNSVKPLVATGKTVNSIRYTKKGDGYEIGASDKKSDMILAVNSKTRRTRRGNTVQPARDALIVSDRQFDIIEKELLKSLEKALR